MTPNRTYNPVQYSPVVVKTIIYANIFMFIVSLIYSGKEIGLTLNPLFAFTPSTDVLNFLGASGRYPIAHFETWWSLITANWLHGSLLHIVFNMMALGTVAPLVIKEFGPYRMFSIYTLTGMAGFLLSYAGNVYLTIGASSGLCGLIGAALYFGKSRGGQWGQLVYKQTSGWVLSLVVIGFLMPHINNWGHAGGLLSGIFFGWVLGYQERRKESRFDLVLALFFAAATLFLLGRSVLSGFLLIFI
ncbi:MAG: rhomboid family intramembrane serine protease [Pseudomonadota bacterium]